jgi:hypothetical protein
VFAWTGLLIVCFITLYGVLVVMAMNRTATISVDYVAIINEKAAAVPEDQRAWPFYREAGIALNKRPEPGDSVFYDLDIDYPEWPDQEGWSYYADWIKHHESTIAMIHKGAAFDGMGFIVSGTTAEEDRELFPDHYFSQQTEEPDDVSVMKVMFPQLSHIRQMARLLRYDTKVAAIEGDSDRCFSDIESMLQLAVHVREHPLLISDLVSLSIFSMAFETIRDILELEPDTFSSQQRLELREQLLSLDAEFKIRFDGERMFMYDIAQRVYTDDGNGDGSLIISNMIHTASYLETFAIEDENNYSIFPLLAPITDLIFASRKELITEYDLRLDRVEAQRGVPLYEWRDIEVDAIGPLDSPQFITNKYFFINLLIPALEKPLLYSQYARAHRNGIVASLYAVGIHQKTGEWPLSLAEAGVTDGWTGKQVLIATVDGNPVIYSTGVDQDDDGGTYHEDAKAYRFDPNTIPDGDWVFYAPNQ